MLIIKYKKKGDKIIKQVKTITGKILQEKIIEERRKNDNNKSK